MAPRKKMTREERLEKKRVAERARYQKIKNDPIKYDQQKIKDKRKYDNKKEKGQIKTVNQMTPREQRKARKLWREKAKNRRRRLALQNIRNTSVTSENNFPLLPPTPQIAHIDRRAHIAHQKSIIARKARNLLINTQAAKIVKMKTTIARIRKRLQRVSKKIQVLTPNSKVNALVASPKERETIKTKLLFSEVLSQQLEENFANLSTEKEKRVFKRVISGNLVKKYNVFEKNKEIKSLKKISKQLTLSDKRRKERKNCVILKKRIEKFMEEDVNSRVCAGKKDCITKQGERKQKRVMLDTLLNLYKLFMKKTKIKMSYSMFCKLRPYWVLQSRCDNRNTCMCVTHTNIDLMLISLYNAKIISVSNYVGLLNSICCNRYNEKCLSRHCNACKNKGLHYKEFDNSVPLSYKMWKNERQDIVDPKTKKTRTVTKCVKSTLEKYPRDLILDLESKLEKFLGHEFNIVHQYQAMKVKKESLTDEDAIIHMDFSENYLTKYSEEVQSFHFGGSRQQISMHTVVVYTKEVGKEVESKCFCTLSKNLSHSPPAIWAHLQPILDSLPTTIQNLHFLSDGPVTQYRNKIMFKVLATMLHVFYPNLVNFSWNYHEAGHGKGAPDGVGATCKRTADRLVASGTDISCLDELSEALQKNCANIKVLIIDDVDILEKEAELGSMKDVKTFTGTLKVHQVTGSIFLPNRLVLKSLSCFCDLYVCRHFTLGTLDYLEMNTTKPHLHIEDIYGKSDTDDEPLAALQSKQSTEMLACSHNTDTSLSKMRRETENEAKPSTSGIKSLSNGDFVLVKLMHKNTEYRYIAMCTGVEDDEVQVVFCKICDDSGKNFKIDDNDISFISWEQIIRQLPAPNLKMKGQRIFYSFNKSIDVFEQA